MLAALGVFGTQSIWPDLVVASIMAFLGLTAAWSVTQQSLQERRDSQVIQSRRAD